MHVFMTSRPTGDDSTPFWLVTALFLALETSDHAYVCYIKHCVTMLCLITVLLNAQDAVRVVGNVARCCVCIVCCLGKVTDSRFARLVSILWSSVQFEVSSVLCISLSRLQDDVMRV